MGVSTQLEVSICFPLAANCYKNVNPEDAISSLRQAAAFLTELGKFKQIGRIHKDIAEIYEKEGSYDEGMLGRLVGPRRGKVLVKCLS